MRVLIWCLWVGLFAGISYWITASLISKDDALHLSKSQVRLLGLASSVIIIIGSLTPILWFIGHDVVILLPLGLLWISFSSMLSITAVVDAASKYIYDYTLLVFSAINVGLLLWLRMPVVSIILGSLYGGGLYLAIRWLSQWLFKKEAFGLGDVFLMAAIGLVLGSRMVWLAAFGAFYIALAYVLVIWVLKRGKGMPEYIPFGPFMCLSAWIILFWGNKILALYLGI